MYQDQMLLWPVWQKVIALVFFVMILYRPGLYIHILSASPHHAQYFAGCPAGSFTIAIHRQANSTVAPQLAAAVSAVGGLFVPKNQVQVCAT